MPHSIQRLSELRTRLSLAIGLPELSGLLPTNVVDSIDLLLNQDISRESANWFLSEISRALSQRLSGIELGALLGRTGGILERQGGTQRLLVACDNLLYKAYCMLVHQLELPTVGGSGLSSSVVVPRPMLLSIFDFPTDSPVSVPEEIIDLDLSEDVPIFIHISTNKYQPWYFVAAIRLVWERITRAIDKAARILDGSCVSTLNILQDRLGQEAKGLSALASFIQPELLVSVIAEADEILIEDRSGQIIVDEEQLEGLIEIAEQYRSHAERSWRRAYEARLARRTDSKLRQHEESFEDAIQRSAGQLARGLLLPRIREDDQFISILNAFLQLCMSHSTDARVYSSFVYSLCSLGYTGGASR